MKFMEFVLNNDGFLLKMMGFMFHDGISAQSTGIF